jgi:hypothetical protein
LKVDPRWADDASMLPPTTESPEEPPDGIVPTERDIWIAANSLIKLHGVDAALMAATRADMMAALGDEVGYALWKRIVRAIIDLGRMEPSGKAH